MRLPSTLTTLLAAACFLLLFWLSAATPALAQTTKPTQPLLCGTEELAPAQRQALEAEAAFALKTKRATQGKATVITYVPIRPHILRRTNGTGGFTMNQLNQVMALTNSRFLQNGLGIQFYLAGTTPDYVDNDTWFANFDATNDTEDAIAGARDANNAMNAYFTQAMPPNGYAYYPDNGLYSTRMFLKGTLDTYYLGSGTMPHELGHNFNLLHTFGSTQNGPTDELVTRGAGANCTTAGDLICDTPADPGRSYPGFSVANQNGCDAYTGNCRDANGASFSPDITNLMSYYNATACRDHFTPGQYDRIDAGLATRQAHTAYSLNYPSTNVSAPTNVAVTRSGTTAMVITWSDNANNEMGYFIERSTTSYTDGFTPVGGVAPNVTTFLDNAAPANGTVFYRVRPSNSTGNISVGVSPVCQPVFVYGCTRSVGFGGFTINNIALSQNTGCASGTVGYSQYRATSPTVFAGQTYSFSGTLLGNPVGITIWADLNRNGSFGDAGEKLFQTPAATLTTAFSGTLTIPTGTLAGALPLRIVSSYLNIPGTPCGNYDDGETEDYQLNVELCRPVFVYGCTRPVGFDGFTINNIALSQNTGCASGTVGYSQYTATTPTIFAGQTYSFSGTLLSSGNPVGITIWADLNRNGSFGDAGEKLFQTPTATLTTAFSGTLTIPTGTLAGALPLRIVSSYLNIPGTPCGNYDDGETEDYQLNIGTTRYVSQTGFNTNPASATSWATATADLRATIDFSEAGDQVFVKTGLYKPTTTTDPSVNFAMKAGVAIYGSFNGTETALSQRPKLNLTAPVGTTLSGDIGTLNSNTDNSYHVVKNPTGLDNTAILDGFVITAGNANDFPSSAGAYGGGVYNSGSSPTLRNCLFQRNNANSGGAAVYNNGGSPLFLNCAFQSNSASLGGAIYTVAGNPVLTICSFQSNTASYGGAIAKKLSENMLG